VIKKKIRKLVEETVKNFWGEIKELNFEVEKPKKEIYGNYSTNVALVLKNKVNLSPLEIAEKIVSKLRDNTFVFEKIEIAPPAFINFWISTNY